MERMIPHIIFVFVTVMMTIGVVSSVKFIVQVVDHLSRTSYAKDRQRPPSFFNYNKGYTHVYACAECPAVGHTEDVYGDAPCIHCGGEVEYKIGKWTGDQWILKKSST